MVSLKSSTRKTTEPLATVSATEAELFLSELANLIDKPEAADRFQRRFEDVMPKRMDYAQRRLAKTRAAKDYSRDYPLPEFLYNLRTMVRRIWREPNSRTREWLVFRLRQTELIATDSRFGLLEAFDVQVPSATRFELILGHMLNWADKLHCCGNEDCAAPYFFAKRRSQKYCSPTCALPAQRKSKLQWWSENGAQWRKSLRKKKPRKRR
jgi:hypothetical protein